MNSSTEEEEACSIPHMVSTENKRLRKQAEKGLRN